MATSKRERQRQNREKGKVEAVEVEEQTEKKQNYLKYAAIGLVVLLALILYSCLSGGNDDDNAAVLTAGSKGTQAQLELWEKDAGSVSPALRNQIYAQDGAPPDVLDTTRDYEAVISTEHGDMRFRLFDNDAPLTVNNFISLAGDGFYDDLTFHLVRNDLAQTGSPTGSGTGGPGYEFINEFAPANRLDAPGMLAMANKGVTNTNGSQFFITRTATGLSAVDFTVFGEIIEGEDVLAAITLRDPETAEEFGDVMETITIEEVTG